LPRPARVSPHILLYVRRTFRSLQPPSSARGNSAPLHQFQHKFGRFLENKNLHLVESNHTTKYFVSLYPRRVYTATEHPIPLQPPNKSPRLTHHLTSSTRYRAASLATHSWQSSIDSC
jgi:hypothetical protein